MQRHLEIDLASLGKVKNGDMRGLRLTVYMEGTPTISGRSWTNQGQINLAIHGASSIHMAVLKNEKGELLKILILTPYAQANRDVNRKLAEVSPWDICKAQVSGCTIDAAQGAEADLVITAYIAGDRGGFVSHGKTGRCMDSTTAGSAPYLERGLLYEAESAVESLADVSRNAERQQCRNLY